jgi:hypothetical protein
MTTQVAHTYGYQIITKKKRVKYTGTAPISVVDPDPGQDQRLFAESGSVNQGFGSGFGSGSETLFKH